MRRAAWILPLALLGVAAAFLLLPDRAKPSAPAGRPQRIVCLAPSLTETVFALGAGDRVVGVTEWCDVPPEAKTRAKVGGMGEPNLEAIVALHPDLVLVPGIGKTDAYQRLRELGYRVEVVDPHSVGETLETIRVIGAWIGAEAAVNALVHRMAADRDALAARIAGRPPVRAVFVVGHDPLFVAGEGTFVDDLLRTAGAENACSDAKGWARYGMEEFLARNPDVILDSTMGNERGSDEALVAYWAKWKDLGAVAGKRVYAVDSDLTNRPGPRIVDAIEHLARFLHPEAFR